MNLKELTRGRRNIKNDRLSLNCCNTIFKMSFKIRKYEGLNLQEANHNTLFHLNKRFMSIINVHYPQQNQNIYWLIEQAR